VALGAREVGVQTRHIEVAEAVESEIAGVLGKPLQMNVSVALPAVLLDADFPLSGLKGIPILARAAGLIGHLLEEIGHPIGFAPSYQAAREAVYTGAVPQGFSQNPG
jgi:citrate synthase